MKVNLYYAPYPSQIFSDSTSPVNTERPFNPKSALPTLASGLRMFAGPMGFDCDIEIIDMQIGGEHTFYKSIPYGPRILNCYRLGHPFEAMEEKIRSGDIHGITSDYTNSAQIVADLAAFIKRLCPDSLVVVGGTDATARPLYYLRRGADVVVRGEGEYVFARLVQARALGRDFDDIPNLFTRDHPAGTPVDFSHLLDMNDLETMSLDLVGDLSLYTDTAEGPPPPGVRPNYICFETSRGCYWRCSFCTAPSRGRYRYMSPKTVERHFKYFRDMGIRTLVFQEDNPLSRVQQTHTGHYLHNQGREEVLEIFHLARDYGFAWEFANGLEFCKFRPEGSTELDRDLMDALLWNRHTDDEWVGCYRVQIPLDNLNLEEKKRFPKLLDFEDQLHILATMLDDYGVIHQTYDLFIGYPEHDRTVLDRFTEGCLRIRDTLGALSSEYQPYFNVFNLALLPGAKDYETLSHLLAFDIDENPEVIAIFLSAINTNYFTYYDVFEQRVAMTNVLNDASKISRYDGIYTGVTAAAAAS